MTHPQLGPERQAWFEQAVSLIDEERMRRTVLDLTAIHSPTGRERAASEFMVALLAEAGLDAWYQPMGEDSGNAAARLRGRGGGPSLLLYAPIDTHLEADPATDIPWVGPTLRQDMVPDPILRDGLVVGLGAANPKAMVGHAGGGRPGRLGGGYPAHRRPPRRVRRRRHAGRPRHAREPGAVGRGLPSSCARRPRRLRAGDETGKRGLSRGTRALLVQGLGQGHDGLRGNSPRRARLPELHRAGGKRHRRPGGLAAGLCRTQQLRSGHAPGLGVGGPRRMARPGVLSLRHHGDPSRHSLQSAHAARRGGRPVRRGDRRHPREASRIRPRLGNDRLASRAPAPIRRAGSSNRQSPPGKRSKGGFTSRRAGPADRPTSRRSAISASRPRAPDGSARRKRRRRSSARGWAAWESPAHRTSPIPAASWSIRSSTPAPGRARRWAASAGLESRYRSWGGFRAACIRLDAFGPGRADIGEDVPDFVVRHHLPETLHAALEPGNAARLHQRLAAELGVVEQEPVVVVPGVAGRVVGRRREEPVLADLPPVGLAFELHAVAGGAVLLVQHLPVPQVAVVQLVAGERRARRQQRDHRQQAPHATSTQVFIPDAWCPSVWQWISHLPGLSNTQSTSRLFRGSTSVVSR